MSCILLRSAFEADLSRGGTGDEPFTRQDLRRSGTDSRPNGENRHPTPSVESQSAITMKATQGNSSGGKKRKHHPWQKTLPKHSKAPQTNCKALQKHLPQKYSTSTAKPLQCTSKHFQALSSKTPKHFQAPQITAKHFQGSRKPKTRAIDWLTLTCPKAIPFRYSC